jgi:hypothetical protein
VYRKGDWNYRDHRVASMPRLAFEGLELCDGKLSRTVLRGLGDSNVPGYPVLTNIGEKITFAVRFPIV